MALLSTLTDPFSAATLDPKWGLSNTSGGSATIAAGRLALNTVATAGSNRGAVLSSGVWTAENSRITVQLTASAPALAAGNHSNQIQVRNNLNGVQVAEFFLSGGILKLNTHNGTSVVANTIGTYDPTAMAWLRLIFTTTTVHASTSPDGYSWTSQGTYNTVIPTGDNTKVYFANTGVSTGTTASTAYIDNVNLAATAAPVSIADPDALGNPGISFNPVVTPDSITDTDTLGAPTVEAAITPGGYGTGLYGDGVYGGEGTPPPTGYTNYQYGAGTYGEGPYYGYVGAPTDDDPRDNPTYGSGTYGYGIYYGAIQPSTACTPLFNDFAGTGQPALHILGIGPWSPVIHWRGAANYGVGPGNLPARPALPLPPATSKGFTLRLDEGSEARFDLNLSRGSALIIDEMDTDLWWRRRDPRTKQVEIIGRFNVSHVNTSTSDSGLNVSVQCDDYATVLGARMVLRYLHPDTHESMWDQGTPITEILKWAIPANTRLDLSELDTYDLGNITQPYTLPPGTTLAEVFEQLNAVSPIRWEWWIETPNDINAAPKLRFQLGTRGLDKGVVLFDLGKGPSPIASWTRNTAADNYANSLIYNGADGSVVQVIDAQVIQYGQRDATAGNSTIDGTHIQLMRARANTKLAKLASRQATYTISLASGFWRGRTHIDVGDTVTLLLRLGKETLKEKHRVTEIAVEIDAQGAEEVTLTLGTPLPSPDPRSKRSPLQRIVRHLATYEAPPGSADVIGPDEE